MGRETIDVVGARTNNLRDVSVSIPKGQLVAFTGVSGSGRTSLAIDTLDNEAQLRYLEGLSPFVRQYITQRNRPKVDRILGLGATLAVDQRRLNRNPRSTVATIIGIDGHLGLLYSRLPGIGPNPACTRLTSSVWWMRSMCCSTRATPSWWPNMTSPSPRRRTG